jgi:hypothetical protein
MAPSTNKWIFCVRRWIQVWSEKPWSDFHCVQKTLIVRCVTHVVLYIFVYMTNMHRQHIKNIYSCLSMWRSELYLCKYDNEDSSHSGFYFFWRNLAKNWNYKFKIHKLSDFVILEDFKHQKRGGKKLQDFCTWFSVHSQEYKTMINNL